MRATGDRLGRFGAKVLYFSFATEYATKTIFFIVGGYVAHPTMGGLAAGLAFLPHD